MSLAPRPLRALLLALALLPLAACDETGGMTADVDVAVEDAVIARQGGDYEAAVVILQRALEAEPQNAKVRVELATTILERDDVDLLDIDRIAQHVAESAGATAAPSGGVQARGGCAVASDPTAQEFDPTAIADFPNLVARAGTIKEALALLAPVMPEALTTFDVCTSVVDGQLAYDRDGALASLRARGLSEARVKQVLAVNALARLVDAYLFVTVDVPQQTTWYRRADGSITICADDEEALMAQAEAAVGDLGEAVLSLDARASLMRGDSPAAEIVDLALDAFEEIRDAVGDYCATR